MRLPSPAEAVAVGTVVPHWDAFVEAVPYPAWVVDTVSRAVVAVNVAAARLLGLPVDVLAATPADLLLATPEDAAYWEELRAGAAPLPLSSEATLVTADGRTLWVMRSIRPLAEPSGGAATRCLVMLVDRSEQQRADDERERALAELQATLEATADGILVTDLAGRIRCFNHRFAQLWDLPPGLHDGSDAVAVDAWLRRSVTEPENYGRRLAAVQQAVMLSSSDRLRLHSGQVFERVTRPLWWRGRPQGRVYSFRDLTDRLAAEARIDELATTDPVTGLPNRRQLAERVARSVAQVRGGGRGFALLVVDLDRFHHVNDSLGHEAGDRVLVDVAQRLAGAVRQDDMLVHIGGDQFALVLVDADATAAESSARRVLNAVAQPCVVDGAPFTLTCSIGIALCPADGMGVDELLGRATSAMQTAKEGGRAGWRFHQRRGDVDFRMQMRLDHAMRQALVSGRFRLHYQPRVALADGRVVGAEALIRWRDPELGEVPPGRFIPVAEDSGFIVAIGEWVLAQAVRQAALWHERGLVLPVAVNLSALQFKQPQFVEHVAQVLAVSRLPPHLLELELTESTLLRDIDEALLRLHALKRLGVQLSFDDFGTGYSSLTYLKRIDMIDKLKIDRAFVGGLPGNGRDAGIVRAILQMAHTLGMQVVAEGVETEGQRAFLADAGCGDFQGFLFSPALDPLSFERRTAGLVQRRDGGPAPA
ncbi:MAG: EAL domain-containing protein [Rubrivivax sp.]|jgi:diguanylate cyclase (GGDEF)-like protein|nr:EAL domain-containing protein [Rubrivivax sp.]